MRVRERERQKGREGKAERDRVPILWFAPQWQLDRTRTAAGESELNPELPQEWKGFISRSLHLLSPNVHEKEVEVRTLSHAHLSGTPDLSC